MTKTGSGYSHFGEQYATYFQIVLNCARRGKLSTNVRHPFLGLAARTTQTIGIVMTVMSTSTLLTPTKIGAVLFRSDLGVVECSPYIRTLFPVLDSEHFCTIECLQAHIRKPYLRPLILRILDINQITETPVTLKNGKRLLLIIVPFAGEGKASKTVMLLFCVSGEETTQLGTPADLETKSKYDSLTEVLSYEGMEERLSEELVHEEISGNRLMAVFIDCDDLGMINETLGHEIGDIVIKETARRLQHSLRSADFIARVEADKFLAVLPNTRAAEAHYVANRLKQAIGDTPLEVRGSSVNVTASVVVGRIKRRTALLEEVIAEFQRAMTVSKKSGKNRVAELGGECSEEVVPGSQAMASLFSGDVFRVVLQTIRSTIDESVVGYELLSRGPEGPLESPDCFLRAAAEHNILTAVDLRCVVNALNVVRSLRQPLHYHINIMPTTLLQTPSDTIEELFKDLPKDAELCIEISEQQFIGDPGYLAPAVKHLKNIGIKVAIDDVGFGRSSLESLIVLEPDVIKIDRTFVQGISTSKAKRQFLGRLLNVTRTLEAEAVAEGVEKKEDLEILRDMGIQKAQGFYWERPMELESVRAIVNASAKVEAHVLANERD